MSTVAAIREQPKEDLVQAFFKLREESAALKDHVRAALESLPPPPNKKAHDDDLGVALSDGVSRIGTVVNDLRKACEVAYSRNSRAIDQARKNRVPVAVLTAMAKEGEIFRAALQNAGPA